MSILKLGLIGKSPPGKIKDIMNYLTRSKVKNTDLPDVFPASQAPIPKVKEDVAIKDAINRFVRDNPRTEKAGGGMLVQPGFGGTRQGYKKDIKKRKTYTDTLGRTYDVDNMGRPMKLEGKTGKVVKYLLNLSDGAEFYKPDIAKLLNLGVGVKDGKEYVDTSLLTKIINRRPELKNKNFKFLTKTDVTVKKINNFVTNYLNENNGKFPTQGEIVKGVKVDPTRLRTYIVDGLVDNVADTVFDIQTKATNYILNTKKPTISGLEKIVGKNNANKILSRVYINSLKSLNNKINKVDEGRSVYANFNQDQVELLKNKVRRVPGFNNLYEREITDLIANAYPDPKDAAKKKAALKKVSMFKRFNKEVSKKFGFNQVLDHPLSYDFITKTSQGVDASELIRVRPLPDRVNTFKSFLESDLEEISNTLKKGYDQKVFSKYEDIKSIADELKIPFPTMAKTGTITSPAASKVGTKPLIGDAKQAAVIQNNFRSFVQKVKDDPRMKRLGINLKELKDLAKLPKVNIAKYDAAINKFIQKSGKFGLPFAAGYLGVRELSTPAQAADGAQATGFTTGEKLAGAGTAVGAYKFRKPIIKGAKAVGRTAMKALGPLAAPLELAFIGSDLKSGSTVPEAIADVALMGGIFRERDKRKFIEDKYGTETLNRYVAAKTPGITDVMDMPTALPALSQELQAIDAEADAYLQTLRGQRAEEFKIKSALPKPQIDAFQAAGGGIAKLAGDRSGAMLESMNPDKDGLQGLMKRGIKG